MDEVKLLPCPFCEGEVEAIHAKHDLIWLEHLDHNRCSVFNDGVWTTTKAWNTRPTTVVTDEVVERAHEAADRLYDLALCSPRDSLAYRTNMRIAKGVAAAIAKIGGVA